MSLFYQHTINPDTKLGIWRIEEPETFFLDKVPLLQQVHHFHKRLQHLAGRYLLPLLFENFPLAEILIADTRKPFLEKEQYHFSISHCGDFAAAIVSKTSRVGIDVEIITPRILSIGHKFLSPLEYELAQGKMGTPAQKLGSMDDEWLTLLWSAKEALFKWYGRGGLDFKEHLQLKEIIADAEGGWTELHFDFRKDSAVRLIVKGRYFDRVALAWVISSGPGLIK